VQAGREQRRRGELTVWSAVSEQRHKQWNVVNVVDVRSDVLNALRQLCLAHQPANNRPLPNYSGPAVYCWPSVSDTCYGSLTTKQASYQRDYKHGLCITLSALFTQNQLYKPQ